MLCDAFLEHLRREGGVWECDKGTGTLKPFNGKPEFHYGSMMRFTSPKETTKKPVVMTATRSWPEGKKNVAGMHYDLGFLRCTNDDMLEWTIASNNGSAEHLRGEVAKTDDQNVKTFTALLQPVGTLNLGGALTMRQLSILEPTEAQQAKRVSMRHTMFMTASDAESSEDLREHLTEIYRPVDAASFTVL